MKTNKIRQTTMQTACSTCCLLVIKDHLHGIKDDTYRHGWKYTVLVSHLNQISSVHFTNQYSDSGGNSGDSIHRIEKKREVTTYLEPEHQLTYTSSIS